MTHELFFTSAERGLDVGATGFCTVKRTRSMSKRLERLLHELSVYRALYPPNHPSFGQNPVIFSHCRAHVDGQTLSIMSRMCAAPPDYSGRSNYFAHHVVLNANELPQAGPVWLARQPGFLEGRWNGEVTELQHGRPVPQGQTQPRPCATWQRVTGDAGWAGVLAKYLLENSSNPVYLIAGDDVPVLDLLDEVIGLLPPEKRWLVTFTTRYTHLPTGVTCAVRVVPPGSQKVAEAKSHSRCLDLEALRDKRPADDSYSQAARAGQVIEVTKEYLRDQSEMWLPSGPEAFSHIQVGGPIRHNPGLGAVPAVGASVPPPPPQPTQPPASSRALLWLLLLVLLQLAVTVGLAISLVVVYTNASSLLREQVGDLKKNVDAISSSVNNLKSEFEKKTADIVEASAKKAVDELRRDLKEGKLRQEVLTEILEKVDPEQLNLIPSFFSSDLVKQEELKVTDKDKGRKVLRGKNVRKVLVYAPNARIDGQKHKTLVQPKDKDKKDKDSWDLDDKTTTKLTLSLSKKGELTLSWDEKKTTDVAGILSGMTLLIFTDEGVQFLYVGDSKK